MSEPSIAILPPGTGRYRLRLQGDIAEQLTWPRPASGFQCLGYFRSHGELICIAEDVENADRIAQLRQFNASSPPSISNAFSEIPSISDLIANTRVIEFRAIWLKPPHTQLELQLSAPNLSRLGWHTGATSSIVALAYPKTLFLLSEQRFAEAHADLDI